MSVTLSGSVTVTGVVNMDPGVPISATAGTTTVVSGGVGVAVSFSVFASVTGGNSTSYVYAISSGTLPAGLTLNTAVGVVSGTPTTVQSASNVTFTVSDAFGQRAATTVTISFTVSIFYTVQYLVVAGGGGSGAAGPLQIGTGGGGGGGVLAYNATLAAGTTYTITIGSGGAGGGFAPGIPASSGCNSSITGGTLTGIVAIGGGSGQGSPGGSGGGNSGGGAIGSATGYPSPAPLFYTPTGAQGYPGTIGGAPLPIPGYTTGGAGGGAGGAGTGTGCGASGGVGYTWPYTNTAYGGGGGGGATYGNSGGPAGGGNGANAGTAGSPGTPGKGGGGGGAYYRQNGFSGGSGVVIIAVPTPNYPGSAPGATVTTPPSAPGMTVITFTAPGTYTA